MKPELPLLIIGFLALVAAVVLSAIGQSIPVELWALAAGMLGGGLGVTIPTSKLESDVSDVETVVRAIFDEADSRTATTPAASTPTATPAQPAAAPVAVVQPVAATS